jgi:hypothetical protein
VSRRDRLQVVQRPAALGVRPPLEAPGDPGAVGRGQRVDQARIVGPPREQLAQQPQPAPAVLLQQRLGALPEQQPVDAVVEPRPGRVARADRQVILERLVILAHQGEPVPLGQEHVLEVLDLPDATPLDPEVARLGVEQVDGDLAGRALRLVPGRHGLGLLAGQADVALRGRFRLPLGGAGLSFEGS